MTTVPYIPSYAAPENYLNFSHKVKSWLLTKDHKRIGILYLFSVTFFFIIGGVAATLMRIHLLTPSGLLVEPETYNRLFTIHGITMVFFFLVPAIPATLGNFLIPLMVGARDLAFPRINLASWYLFNAAGLMAVLAIIFGGMDTGWTFYTPYSSVYSNSHVGLTIIAVFLAGFSSIFTALNFIVTVHTMRCPGMNWFRLPLFVWSMYATSLLIMLGTPVVAITLVLVLVERTFKVGIFNPAWGGDPILFQHLFWFYSHPAVYIMVLPAFAIISEIVPCFARKRIFGYEVIALASIAIAAIGFLVWAHHMFLAGISMYAGMVFSALSFLVAVPSAVKVFNWTATLYRGSVYLATPMLYAGGFVGLFTLGGLTGLMLATLGLDIHVHDTYFVIAHFHYVMVGGTIMGFLGGIHFWWPKMTGKLYNDMAGRVSAVIIFLGFNLTFFPQFILGYLGMPRRYHHYPQELQALNVLSTAGASILAVGYLLPVIYLTYSLFYGKNAGPNPWLATGLEWQTSSPPPVENFETIPIVTNPPYAYDLLDPQAISTSVTSAQALKHP